MKALKPRGAEEIKSCINPDRKPETTPSVRALWKDTYMMTRSAGSGMTESMAMEWSHVDCKREHPTASAVEISIVLTKSFLRRGLREDYENIF